jgi:hypothetical protein
MPGQSQPRTVFVSHAHADNALCDRYVAALRARGLDVWYDRTNMQRGFMLSPQIETELEQRTAFVVIVTPASNASYWVKLETAAYRGLVAQDPSRLMLPVRVADGRMPLLLNALNWIDAVTLGFDAAVEEIAAALGAAPLVPPAQLQLAGALTSAPTRAPAQPLDAPARDEPDLWRALLHWDVPLGCPNAKEDGEPVTLAEAVNTSVVRTAYTRRERDELHPEPRVLAIARVPSGQWQVWEWRLDGERIGVGRWPMPTLAAAEQYVALIRDARRAKLWWPAHGPLRVEFAPGAYGPPQTADVLGPTDPKIL